MDIIAAQPKYHAPQLLDYSYIHQDSNSCGQPYSFFQLCGEPTPSSSDFKQGLLGQRQDFLDFFVNDENKVKEQVQSEDKIKVQPQTMLSIDSGQQKYYKKTKKENTIKDKKKLNSYYLGHIDYLTSSSWPIFGQSRKYERTKKRRHSNTNSQFKAMAKRMNALKKNAYDVDFAKRFDQELNQSFRALPLRDQEYGDITPSALRNIIENIGSEDNNATLNKFLKVYRSKKYWVDFINAFIKQRQKTENSSDKSLFS